MLDKATQLAEKLATGVSRRGFLGNLGRFGLALSGVLGGLSAFPSSAHAAKPLKCCWYYVCEPFWGCYAYSICTSDHCPKEAGYEGWHKVDSCDVCGPYA